MATNTHPLVSRTSGSASRFLRFLGRELAPNPQRLSGSVRVAIAACIITILGEVGRSQALFIALFVLLSLPREYPKQTWQAALRILATVWCSAPIALLLQALTADLVWLRVLTLGVAIFFCLIVGRGLHLGLVGILSAVVLSQSLIVWDTSRDPQMSVEFVLWFVLMISTGVLVGTAVEYLYPHKTALQRIIPGLVEQLDAVSAMLKDKAGEALSTAEAQRAASLSELAFAGTSSLRNFLPAVNVEELPTEDALLRLSSVLAGVEALIGLAAQLRLYQAEDFDEQQRSYLLLLSTRCCDLACSIGKRDITHPVAPAAFEIDPREVTTSAIILPQLAFLIEDLWETWYGQSPSKLQLGQVPRQDLRPPKKPRNTPGPFFTGDNVTFAFKTALASVICYIIYNAVDWPGISTSVVTCFIVALDTVGATFRKLALRLAGVAVGGLVFGIGGISLVLSSFTNIVELLLLVAAVFFISEWVVLGSQRISYAGVQIGLSFALVALNAPVIPDQIVEARDRFMGVLLGAIVMWFIFRQFWPVSAIAAQRSNIAGLVQSAAKLICLPNRDQSREEKIGTIRDVRDSSNQAISLANDQADAAGFDSKHNPTLQDRLQDCLMCSRALLLMSLVESEFVVARPLPVLPESIHEAARQYRKEYAGNLQRLAEAITSTSDRPSVLENEQMSGEHWARYSEFLDRLREIDEEEDPDKRLYARTRTRILERNRELTGKLADSIKALAGTSREEFGR